MTLYDSNQITAFEVNTHLLLEIMKTFSKLITCTVVLYKFQFYTICACKYYLLYNITIHNKSDQLSYTFETTIKTLLIIDPKSLSS